MKCGKSFETDEFIQLAECIFISFRSANVVAGSECVLGVEAKPQPLILDDGVEYLRHLFKSMA